MRRTDTVLGGVRFFLDGDDTAIGSTAPIAPYREGYALYVPSQSATGSDPVGKQTGFSVSGFRESNTETAGPFQESPGPRCVGV